MGTLYKSGMRELMMVEPRDRRISRILTSSLVLLTGGVAVATPHLVDDHWFSLSTTATQSLVIGLDFALASLFYGFFRWRLRRSELQRRVVQDRLASSFRYIGEANGSLALMENAINAMSAARSRHDVREQLSVLQEAMSVTIAGASATRIRLIERDRGRTITEFEWESGPGIRPPAISNRAVLADPENDAVTDRTAIIRSDYTHGATYCVMALAWKEGAPQNLQLVRTLLNQIHILQVATFNHLVGGAGPR